MKHKILMGQYAFIHRNLLDEFPGEAIYQDCVFCRRELQTVSGREDSDVVFAGPYMNEGTQVGPVFCEACHEKFAKVVLLVEELGNKEFIRNSLSLIGMR